MASARRRAILSSLWVALAFFGFFLPSPSHAEGCSQWDLTGQWRLDQNPGGEGYFVTLDITQTGKLLSGAGQYYNKRVEGEEVKFGDSSKNIEGDISGDTFRITVHWNFGPVGIYTGNISPQGYVEGDTYDTSNPDAKSHWTTLKQATCLKAEGSPEAVAFCNDYADTAIAKVAESQQMQCGFVGGPEAGRWNPDRAAHYEYCISLE